MYGCMCTDCMDVYGCVYGLYVCMCMDVCTGCMYVYGCVYGWYIFIDLFIVCACVSFGDTVYYGAFLDVFNLYLLSLQILDNARRKRGGVFVQSTGGHAKEHTYIFSLFFGGCLNR